MKNPYSWNSVNPDICFGRDKLLQEMLSGLPGSPRFSFGIAGARRMGKTTLLRKVEKELTASIPQWKDGGLHVIPIYIDNLALPESFKANHIWGKIARDAAAALNNSEFSREIVIEDFDAFKDYLIKLLEQFQRRPRIIVLFDEIERIVARDWGRSFFDHWRSLLSNSPGLSEYFTAVFSGAREMELLRRDDLGSPLKDILEWRNLRVLDYEDACELMQMPIEHDWENAMMEYIYDETGGHPMLIQYVMQQVYNTDDNIAAQKAARAAVDKFTNDRGWQFSEWWEKYCTLNAQKIYNRLSITESPVRINTLASGLGYYEADKAIEILQHIGIVKETNENNGFFICSGKMFQNWHKLNIAELANQTPSERRNKKFFEVLQTKDIGLYDEAKDIVEKKDIHNYKNSLSNMKKLFETTVNILFADLGLKLPDDLENNYVHKISLLAENFTFSSLNEIIAEYELLSNYINTFSNGNGDQGNASTDPTIIHAEISQLINRWENIIEQLSMIIFQRQH
jgi:AAA+ ATPase superfamily predicted ATPase